MTANKSEHCYSTNTAHVYFSLSFPFITPPEGSNSNCQLPNVKSIRESKAFLSHQTRHDLRDKPRTSPDPSNSQTWRSRHYKAEALVSPLSKLEEEEGESEEGNTRREWKDLVSVWGWTCRLLLFLLLLSVSTEPPPFRPSPPLPSAANWILSPLLRSVSLPSKHPPSLDNWVTADWYMKCR